MSSGQTKHTAEAVLRELPSVVGVCVHEDVGGHPREVHLLVRSGPDVRDLARDVRSLLEERLGIAIDQRVISIAQFSAEPTPAGPPTENGIPPVPRSADATPSERGAPSNGRSLAAGSEAPTSNGATASANGSTAGSSGQHPAETQARAADLQEKGTGAGRIRYDGLETRYGGARVFARVRLVRGGRDFAGEAEEVDAGQGRARAGAGAMILALDRACQGTPHLRLEAASVGRAFEREYAVVSVVVPALGPAQRPLRLAGAHPVSDGDVVTASALAVLKATNRLVELGFVDMPATP